MDDTESTLLRLASSDLDSDDAAYDRDDLMERAKAVMRDSIVRKDLVQLATETVEACSTFDSYERILTVLVTALFRETSSGNQRDVTVLEALADKICSLIVSSSEHYSLLVTSAEAQLMRIKSDTVSDAFAKVSVENKEVGDVLAISTAKKKRKPTVESIEEQDMLAKRRGRRTTPISSPGAYAISDNDRQMGRMASDELLTQEERDQAAKNRARRSIKVGAMVTPDTVAVREPSAHDRGSRRIITSSIDEHNRFDGGEPPLISEEEHGAFASGVAGKTTSDKFLTQAESDEASKNRARRSTKIHGTAITDNAVREPSEHDRGSRRTVTSASEELSRLETDVVAKNRARRPSSRNMLTPGARGISSASQSSEETDRSAKSRARRSRAAASQLNQLENDVVAKSRGRRSGGNGAAAARLDDLESDVAANPVSRKTRNKGARIDLNTLEGGAQAKSNVRSGGKKHRHLPPSETPGVVFEREDGRIVDPDEYDGDDWDYEKAEALDKDEKYFGDDGRGPLLTADRGIVNEPQMEFGLIQSDDADPQTPVAVLVDASDEEEGKLIPEAVECDPDARPMLVQRRRFRLYGCLACLLLVLIVTVVTKIMVTDNGGSGGPTPAPTSVGEGEIRNQLEAVVGEEKLLDETTPEARAAYWIINEDPMELTADDPNLIQRYVLAVFYLSTTEQNPWLSCNRPEEGQGTECLFKLLVEVFPFIVYEQVEWYRWMSEEHECDWAGVFCDETEIVRALELWGQEISGPLSPYFKELTYMQSIALQWNNFHGTLPKEWAEMQHLLNIEVHYNWLEGMVPEEWWKTSRWAMQRINIAANQFSGTIPTEMGELNGLKGFFSFENQITGTFPTELGNIEFLAFTRMGRNFIDGTIPSELGKLAKMQEIWLHRNQVTGTIPTEIAQMTDVEDIRFHFNPLTGTIPSDFYSLSKLTRLDLYDCDLEGTVPTEVAGMRKMQSFRIRANNFHGTIPTEMGLLTDFAELWIHRNEFTGSIPTELCALRTDVNPTNVGQAQNGTVPLPGLYMVDADCLGTTTDEGFGPPQISCGCCTRCCDGATGICDN